jgi:hypothetical protein
MAFDDVYDPMTEAACATRELSGPFMALSAAGGIRPGVYAGLAGCRHRIPFGANVSAPFTGLLPMLDSDGSVIGLKPTAARRPVNGPLQKKSDTINGADPRQPGVNGPSTACGGKGRKRPSRSASAHETDALAPSARNAASRLPLNPGVDAAAKHSCRRL